MKQVGVSVVLRMMSETARNLRKHGISFDETVNVFGDPLALTFSDTEGRLLVVVHTERPNKLRIISARKATSYEHNIYTEG